MEYSGIFQRKAITTKSTTLISISFFQLFNFDILWNMEYSKILPQQDIFSIFGIWNIPNKTGTRQILKSVEYGIFTE